MSNNETATGTTRTWKRWIIPGTAVLCGLVYLAAGLRGGDRVFAFGGLGVMVATGLAFVILGRKSETVAGLLDRRDERINRIDTDATVFAGGTLIVAVLVGFVVEIARGEDGMPYAALGAISGLAYIVALVVLRLRR